MPDLAHKPDQWIARHIERDQTLNHRRPKNGTAVMCMINLVNAISNIFCPPGRGGGVSRAVYEQRGSNIVMIEDCAQLDDKFVFRRHFRIADLIVKHIVSKWYSLKLCLANHATLSPQVYSSRDAYHEQMLNFAVKHVQMAQWIPL